MLERGLDGLLGLVGLARTARTSAGGRRGRSDVRGLRRDTLSALELLRESEKEEAEGKYLVGDKLHGLGALRLVVVLGERVILFF